VICYFFRFCVLWLSGRYLAYLAARWPPACLLPAACGFDEYARRTGFSLNLYGLGVVLPSFLRLYYLYTYSPANLCTFSHRAVPPHARRERRGMGEGRQPHGAARWLQRTTFGQYLARDAGGRHTADLPA